MDLLGADVFVGARYFNAVLFGVTAGVVGLTILLLTGSIVAGLGAATLVLTSEVVIEVHLWALSEPLYLFTSLVALVLLAGYLRPPHRRALFWAAALAAGIALLVRFAGFSLILAGTLALVAFPQAALGRRLADGVSYGLVGVAPTGTFVLRNLLVSGNPNPADLPQPTWHLPPPPVWQEAARGLLNWALPDFLVESLPGSVALGLLLALIAAGGLAVAWSTRRVLQRNPGGWSCLMLLHLCYGVAYALTVLVTVSLVQRVTPLDDRILSPLYPTAIILGSGMMFWLWGARGAVTKGALVATCVLLAVFQLARFRGLVHTLPSDSRGFASNSWRTSETIAYVRGLPQAPIYSNEIQAIYFLTGRMATFIPTPLNPATGEPRADYPVALARMRERLRSQGGALVLIDPSELSSEELSDLAEGLRLVGEFPDGVVYRPPGD
jgi:hypothetical protein